MPDYNVFALSLISVLLVFYVFDECVFRGDFRI